MPLRSMSLYICKQTNKNFVVDGTLSRPGLILQLPPDPKQTYNRLIHTLFSQTVEERWVLIRTQTN